MLWTHKSRKFGEVVNKTKLMAELSVSSSVIVASFCFHFLIVSELRYQEIDRALEAAAEEDRQLRAIQIEQMKASWEESISTKKTLQATARNVPDYDFSRLSVSSAQLLDGQDESRGLRSKAQKDQMRRWIQEQIAEKAGVREMEREEEGRYAEMLQIIGEMRDASEKEEADMRKMLLDKANRENEEVCQRCLSIIFISLHLLLSHAIALQLVLLSQSIKQKQKEEWDKLSAAEKSKFSSLDLFDEDSGRAMDASGRVIRKDMFKGFTIAQKKRIFQENERVLQQKRCNAFPFIDSPFDRCDRERDQRDKQGNADWNLHQTMIQRSLEQVSHLGLNFLPCLNNSIQAYMEEEALRELEKEKHLSILARQVAEERMRKERAAKERFGSVDPAFFSSFGTSGR